MGRSNSGVKASIKNFKDCGKSVALKRMLGGREWVDLHNELRRMKDVSIITV
jgi:hypothetical protein